MTAPFAPPVTLPSRRRLLAPMLGLSVLLVAGCGATPATPTVTLSGASQPPATVTTSTPRPASPSATSGGPNPAPSGSTTTQTDTDWGRIWDAVPDGFPRFPGATAADDAAPEPVSAAYAVNGTDAGEIATWMQSAMETATYSTEALSGPLEDGGYILDSVGDGDCRLETRMTPQGSLVIVTIRYGAACPAP